MWNVSGSDGGPGVAPTSGVTMTLNVPCVPGGIGKDTLLSGPTITDAASVAPELKDSRFAVG
jgi:hypothetical protein